MSELGFYAMGDLRPHLWAEGRLCVKEWSTKEMLEHWLYPGTRHNFKSSALSNLNRACIWLVWLSYLADGVIHLGRAGAEQRNPRMSASQFCFWSSSSLRT